MEANIKKTKEPLAPKKDVHLEKHGDKRSDPYFWMKERDSKDVLSYLKEENEYLESMLVEEKNLRSNLFDEMKARIVKKDQSAPYKSGNYFYYTRTEEDSNYCIYCRRKDSLESPEEILLNANPLGEKHDFFDISSCKVAPDENFFAYSHDTTGRRIYQISLKDLKTGKTEDNIIKDCTGSFVWNKESKILFYTKQDPETLRSNELWSFDLKSKKNKLLYQEKDETYSLDIWKSCTKRFLFLSSHSTLTTETRYLDLDKKEPKLMVFSKREKGLEYSIEDGGDRFFVLSNLKNKNFSLMETSHKKTEHSNWKNFVEPQEKVLLDDLSVFKDFIVTRESHEGLLKLKVIERDTKNSFYLETKDSSYEIDLFVNPHYDTSKLNYTYESMTSPYSVIQYDMKTKESSLLKEKKIAGDFKAQNYVSKRLFAKARDGEEIPISLVHRKDININETTPLLQYAYGSYGYTVHPYFSSERLSLLDRGFIFALCHIRGGSYKGRHWYESGKMFSKKNTFYDFIDCSKFLIKESYTSPRHLYAEGGSAGGLLMGAIINMEPKLYRGVIAAVPFVDVITTMLDDSIPLTTGEYDEWGNPNNKKDYDYIKSYSPYDNVSKKEYPNLLVTTGYHDSQVQYWEPAKWVAKLRAYKTSPSLLLFHTDFSSGHGGASGRFEHLKDTALNYSFLLHLEKKSCVSS